MSRSYIVHKAVELGKVKKKLVPTVDQLRTEYLAFPKYDGCNMVAVKGAHDPEQVTLYSRTGELVRSAEHIKEALGFATFAPCGVYLGEYWHPEIDRDTVSGWFRDTKQQHTAPYFVCFDFLTTEEFQLGHSPLTYPDRVARLPSFLGNIPEFASPFFLAESQGYLVDQGLTPDEAARLFAEGGMYDGLILRKPSGTWTKGDRGTGGEIIKIKPTLSLDLRVSDIETRTGDKTGRPVYVLWVHLGNGTAQMVGSGVPHEKDQLPRIGDIVEIEAMSYSKFGMLREPRYKGIRHDKIKGDTDV